MRMQITDDTQPKIISKIFQVVGECTNTKDELQLIAPKGLCRESKKSDVRPLVSVRPSVLRPSVRSNMYPKIFMKIVPLSGETYFLNGPKSYTFGENHKIGTQKVFATQRNDFGCQK